jgi:hypothetical protein
VRKGGTFKAKGAEDVNTKTQSRIRGVQSKKKAKAPSLWFNECFIAFSGDAALLFFFSAFLLPLPISCLFCFVWCAQRASLALWLARWNDVMGGAEL